MEKKFDYDEIYRFLNGEMTASEKASFSTRLETDEVLSEEVALQQDLLTSIDLAGDTALKNSIQQTHTELEQVEDTVAFDQSELEHKQEYEKKHELLAKVLDQLKEDCKQIILASFYKKLPHKAIAELMGLSTSFVKVKLHRCMESFRKKARQSPEFLALNK